MSVYGRFVKTGKRLIAKYGEACTWNIPGAVTTDPDQPWQGMPNPPQILPANVAFIPDSTAATINKMGSDVPLGNVTALMGAVSFVPTTAHTITRKDGRSVAIEDINEVNINGESVLFIMRCTQ